MVKIKLINIYLFIFNSKVGVTPITNGNSCVVAK